MGSLGHWLYNKPQSLELKWGIPKKGNGVGVKSISTTWGACPNHTLNNLETSQEWAESLQFSHIPAEFPFCSGPLARLPPQHRHWKFSPPILDKWVEAYEETTNINSHLSLLLLSLLSLELEQLFNFSKLYHFDHMSFEPLLSSQPPLR